MAADNSVERTAAEILTQDALDNDGFNVSQYKFCISVAL